MKNALRVLLLISSFSTQAATCFFIQHDVTDPGHSLLVNTDKIVDVIQSNMIDENIVSRSMFHKSYRINEAGITYKVVHVNRSCGKGCEIGTFLDGIEINGLSYIPEFDQRCNLARLNI